MISITRFGAMLALITLAGGCAHQVAFQDLDYRVDEQLRSEPLIAVVSEAERTKLVPVRSFMAGAAHSWDAEPGQMLVQVAEIELPQMFEQFKLVEHVNSDDQGYVLDLAVPDYTFANFRASLTMHARLLDMYGTELLDRMYQAEGPGRGGRMFWGGAFAMKSAMRTSSLEAFKDVFQQLRADLQALLDNQPDPIAVTE